MCSVVLVVQTFTTLICFPNELSGRKCHVLQLLKFVGGPQKGLRILRKRAFLAAALAVVSDDIQFCFVVGGGG